METDEERLVASWREEESRPFVGWDFCYLKGRMFEGQPPWSYMARAAELMDRSSRLLDMGTGGGERLLELRERWPPFVVVTEDHFVELVGERLLPLGVGVVVAHLGGGACLPFADGAFDLVLNRHSAFAAREVARVLAPGGAFLTQQVHGLWACDLLAAFGAEPQWPDETLENAVAGLRAAGLEIVQAEEWWGELRFADVGAIVYYLKAVPWLVPGFTVDAYRDVLLRLAAADELRFKAAKYLVEARRRG